MLQASIWRPQSRPGRFTAITGASWPHARAAAPGLARYVTLLERGYALHELTFALLFVVIVAVPFRRGQRWAWWAAWIVMIADLGYTFTFGIHDHVILVRSLAVDVMLAVLLLAHVPGRRQGRPTTSPPRRSAAGPAAPRRPGRRRSR